MFAEARAIAPPLPPSPIIIEIKGTFKDMQHSIELDIASAIPRVSDPTDGYAPGVSINDIIGILNLFANNIKRCALRYPLGRSIPKFLFNLLSRSSPFSWPRTKTDFPSNLANPDIKALSSAKFLSPDKLIKFVNKLSIKNFAFGLSSCLAT